MLRLGIAGIGLIAMDYIGLICGGKVPSVQITAMSGRTTKGMERAVETYPALVSAKQFTDYQQMLSSGLVDAVLITTPHGQHPSMTLAALEKGIHVLCEKPVGIQMEEVRQVQHMLDQHPELVCGVMYNRRKSKAYRKVWELMEQGTVGELVRASWIITNLYRTCAYYTASPWRGSWESEGGGILMTQASHQLDLMQWVCGMPVSVLARCSTVDRKLQVENEAELFFTYENGAHGHFIASAHECPGTNRLEICGTRGRITVVEDSEVQILRLQEDERDFARSCPGYFDKVPFTQEVLTFDDSDNKIQQAAMLQNFADAVAGLEDVACPFSHGIRSLEMIQGAYLSNWTAKTVPLPLDSAAFDELYRRIVLENNEP